MVTCSESLGKLRVNVHQDLVLQIGVHHLRSVLGLHKLLYSCLISWTIDRPFGQHRVRKNLPVIFGDLDRAISADLQICLSSRSLQTNLSYGYPCGRRSKCTNVQRLPSPRQHLSVSSRLKNTAGVASYTCALLIKCFLFTVLKRMSSPAVPPLRFGDLQVAVPQFAVRSKHIEGQPLVCLAANWRHENCGTARRRPAGGPVVWDG